MTPDRNKTLSTRKIIAAVILWLGNQGVKPIETETLLAKGCQADIAATIDPTSGESFDGKRVGAAGGADAATIGKRVGGS